MNTEKTWREEEVYRLKDKVDTLKSRIKELEAQVPQVGTFAWALMQDWDKVGIQRWGEFLTLNAWDSESTTDLKYLNEATDWHIQ